jgi:ADP-ribose pyrophosphatase YjhB (NUDIX family)
VTRARVVVYVTREHPVTGADQLLVVESAEDPAGDVESGEAIDDAAFRWVREWAGIETRLARELGSAGGIRYVQALPLASAPDDWQHRGALCRWVPIHAAVGGPFLRALFRQRVVAYVTRERDGRTELLTIEHKDMPEAGVQVPAGRVDPGEDLEQAVLREVAEETGLDNLRLVRKLPEFEAEYENPYESHAFHLIAETEPPDSWEHEVHGEGSDAGLVYVCRWLPLTPDLRLWNGRDPMLRHLTYSEM